MVDQIKNLIREVEEFATESESELEKFRIKFLGKKGVLSSLFNDFKSVPDKEKKDSEQNIVEGEEAGGAAQGPPGSPAGGATHGFLTEAKVSFVHLSGEDTTEERNKKLSLFRNSDLTPEAKKSPRVLLLQLSECAGHNLQVARHVVIIHPYCTPTARNARQLSLAEMAKHSSMIIVPDKPSRTLRMPRT